MIRLSHCIAFAVFASMIASPAAYANTKHAGAAHTSHKAAAHTSHKAKAAAHTNHNVAGVFASARGGNSEMDIRRQCFAEARQRYPSTSQDMQTNRVYTYTTCVVEHGVSNP